MDIRKLLNGKTVAELLTEGAPSGPRISPVEFLKALGDRLWHTTSPARYEQIKAAGAILPEPPLPDSERWKTAGGPKHYPFVRSIGGVSLFDFTGFDPDVYGERYPLSTWQEFVPFRLTWGAAVWMEVDHEAAPGPIIRPKALVEKWNSENAHAHTLMPMIEAAHIGAIPVQVVRRVLFVDGAKGAADERSIGR